MPTLLQRLTKLFWNTKPATRRTERTGSVHLNVEQLEDRQLLSVTDMTGLAQLFPRHSGPTTLYLNFDGNTAQGVSSFQSTTGNRTADIHDIMYRVSETFAPFDVQVRRMSGDGAMDTSSNGNTTVFIGDKTENGIGASNTAGAFTPSDSTDYPCDLRGIHHVPNSDPYDVAYVDPVTTTGSFGITWVAQAVAHEAGHTFGLAHVLSSPAPDIMSYNDHNERFANQTFSITDMNGDGTEPAFLPKWGTDAITTQNSYTYLTAVLGSRSINGDTVANVAHFAPVDASYTDRYMPVANLGSTSLSTTGTVNYCGDYDVVKLSTTTSKWVSIDVKQYSSLLDPVVMVYRYTTDAIRGDGTDRVAFNDDNGGTLNSRVTFYSNVGTSYRIVIGGYSNKSTGDYQLIVANYYSVVTSANLTPANLATTVITKTADYPIVLTPVTSTSVTGGMRSSNLGQTYETSLPLLTQQQTHVPSAPLQARNSSRGLDQHSSARDVLDQVFSQPLHLSMDDPLWGGW